MGRINLQFDVAEVFRPAKHVFSTLAAALQNPHASQRTGVSNKSSCLFAAPCVFCQQKSVHICDILFMYMHIIETQTILFVLWSKMISNDYLHLSLIAYNFISVLRKRCRPIAFMTPRYILRMFVQTRHFFKEWLTYYIK